MERKRDRKKKGSDRKAEGEREIEKKEMER